jgi:hypothetical protein
VTRRELEAPCHACGAPTGADRALCVACAMACADGGSWCMSVTRWRDETGTMHYHETRGGVSAPACGAKPFASGGGEGSGAMPPRGHACRTCARIAAKRVRA